MNIHCLQHVPFEGLAGIESWIQRNGHVLTGTRVYDEGTFPNHSDIDFLIVMGGPMSVGEDTTYHWLKEEKLFLEKFIASGKTVLGVCLGSQLIAEVLGARVYRNRFTEIGWFPVRLTDEGLRSSLFSDFEESFVAFHWHGDTFDVPRGGVRLARSEACEVQAFSYGENVLGLQLHLDSTAESIELLLQNCGGELTDGPYLQRADKIRAGFNHLPSIHNKMSMRLVRLTGRTLPGEIVIERKSSLR